MDVNLIRAIEENFNYKQGTTFDWWLDFFQDDKGTIPTNLDGSTFEMVIKIDSTCHTFAPDLNTEQILTLGSGITIEDDTDGHTHNRIHIYIELDIIPGNYLQEVMWTDAAGKVTQVEGGTLVSVAKL